MGTIYGCRKDCEGRVGDTKCSTFNEELSAYCWTDCSSNEAHVDIHCCDTCNKVRALMSNICGYLEDMNELTKNMKEDKRELAELEKKYGSLKFTFKAED